jgi:hypothetical protein
MTDLIQRLAEAIFRQEGMGEEHTNPGNLRDCPWFPVRNAGKMDRYYPGTSPLQFVQYEQGFWKPRSRPEGVAGAVHVIALRIAQGESLRQLISAWAPPSENDTEAYISNVKNWARIPDDCVPLWSFL